MFFPERIYCNLITSQIHIFSNFKSKHLKVLLNSINYPFLVMSHIPCCFFKSLPLSINFYHFISRTVAVLNPGDYVSRFSCLEIALVRRGTWWDTDIHILTCDLGKVNLFGCVSCRVGGVNSTSGACGQNRIVCDRATSVPDNKEQTSKKCLLPCWAPPLW